MSETLVIRLRAGEEAPASWLIVDGQRRRLRAGGRAVPFPTLLNLVGRPFGRAAVPVRRDHACRARAAVARRRAHRTGGAVRARGATGLRRRDAAFRGRRADARRRPGTPVAVVARSLDRALARRSAKRPASSSTPPTPIRVGRARLAGRGCTLLLDDRHAVRAPSRRACPTRSMRSRSTAALELALRAAGRRWRIWPVGARRFLREHRRSTSGTATLIEGLRSRTATLQVKLLPDGAAAAARGAGGDRRRRQPAAGPVRRALLARQSRCSEWRLPRGTRRWHWSLVFVVEPGPVDLVAAEPAEKALDAADRVRCSPQALPGQPVVDPRAQMQGALGSRRLRPAAALLAGDFRPRAGDGAGAGRPRVEADQLPRQRRSNCASPRRPVESLDGDQAGHEPVAASHAELQSADAARPGCRRPPAGQAGSGMNAARLARQPRAARTAASSTLAAAPRRRRCVVLRDRDAAERDCNSRQRGTRRAEGGRPRLDAARWRRR